MIPTKESGKVPGLTVKFLLVVVPLFLLLSVPGLYFLVGMELRDDQDNLAARMGNKAARIASLLERHGGLENQSLAQGSLATLADDQAFLCAELTIEGLADTFAAMPAHIGCAGQPEKLFLDVPLGDARNANLHLRFTDSELAVAATKQRNLTQLVVAVSFLFAVLAAVAGFRLIVNRPLSRLLSAIRASTETGVRTPLNERSRDELGQVMNAFDEMMAREAKREADLERSNTALRSSEANLKSLNEELEERILERTARLKERELALSESQERFRHFAEASSDWFWEMDEELRFSYFSQRFTEVTGVPEEMLLGKTREESGIPNVDPIEWQSHLDALHRHKPFKGFIHPRTKSDGSVVWLSISGSPVFDGNRNFVGYRGSGADITELVNAKREAELASDAKSQFLATMSHEVRTPMNGVLGMASLLSGTELSLEQKRYVERIKQSGDNLLHLLNEILDLSKIEAQKIELEKVPFTLTKLLSGISAIFDPRAREKDLKLRVAVTPEARIPLAGDEGRIRQIVSNLVGNAIKFTEQGEILVRADTEEMGDGSVDVCFEVTDSGVGIAADARERLFERFSQGDTTITRRYGGTGLGLSICKELTELMGGDIGFESEEGKGSRFWVRINCAKSEPDVSDFVTSTSTTKPSGPGLDRKLRVLVAEDNLVNQEIVKTFLERDGHSVDVVASGLEAVQNARQFTYDIILMDIHMPEMGGIEATKLIRQQGGEGSLTTPIIALTADAMAGDRERYLELGMDDYASKPIERETLFAVIHRCLSRSDGSQRRTLPG